MRQTNTQLPTFPKLQSPVSAAVRHLVKPLQSVIHACASGISFIGLDPNLDFRIGLHWAHALALAPDFFEPLHCATLNIWLLHFPSETQCAPCLVPILLYPVELSKLFAF